MSDLRREDPVRPGGSGDSALPQALSDSDKSSILGSTEMMQSHPNRSSTEEPSEDGATDPAAQPGPPDAAEPVASRPAARVTFGEELRRERELRQVGLREVAEATKINRRYLEALERNDFSDLPGGLFNRSFVRAYCKTIGIDDEAMVNAYLLEEQVQAANADQFDPDVWRGSPSSRGTPRRPVRPAQDKRAPRAIWWWVIVIVVLAAAAAALIYQRYATPDADSVSPAGDAVSASVLTTPGVAMETNY